MNDPDTTASPLPPKPKWYQSHWFTLLFVAAFILISIILILYVRGIDPVIAEFYIFKPAQTP